MTQRWLAAPAVLLHTRQSVSETTQRAHSQTAYTGACACADDQALSAQVKSSEPIPSDSISINLEPFPFSDGISMESELELDDKAMALEMGLDNGPRHHILLDANRLALRVSSAARL